MTQHTPLKYVGTRYPFESPSHKRIEMHVVSTNHPNGEWEAIFCNTKEYAEFIVTACNAHYNLLGAMQFAINKLSHYEGDISRIEDASRILEEAFDKALPEAKGALCERSQDEL